MEFIRLMVVKYMKVISKKGYVKVLAHFNGPLEINTLANVIRIKRYFKGLEIKWKAKEYLQPEKVEHMM